jgi:hypothetical protein
MPGRSRSTLQFRGENLRDMLMGPGDEGSGGETLAGRKGKPSELNELRSVSWRDGVRDLQTDFPGAFLIGLAKTGLSVNHGFLFSSRKRDTDPMTRRQTAFCPQAKPGFRNIQNQRGKRRRIAGGTDRNGSYNALMPALAPHISG